MKYEKKSKVQLIQELKSLQEEFIAYEKAVWESDSQLKSRQNSWWTIFETIPDALIITDMDYNVKTCNRSVERVLGYTPNELKGMNYSLFVAEEMFHDQEQPNMRKELFKKGYLYQEEYLFKRKSGEVFPAYFSAALLKNEMGEPTGVVGTIHDISSRKQAVERLKEIQQVYQDTIEVAHGVPYKFRYMDKHYEFIGEGCEELLEIPNEEFTVGKLKELIKEIVITDKSAPKDKKEYVRQFQKGEINQYKVDLRIITPNGEEKWVSDNSIPLLDNTTGEVIGSMGILQDITERVCAEKELRESESKFRTVIERSNDGIYIIKENQFVFINPKFSEITGYKSNEICIEGFDFRRLVAEDGLSILAEREALREKGEEVPDRYEFKGLKRDDTEIDLEVSVTTIDWKGAPATLGIVRDITERIQARRALQQALESAEKANKVKSLFLANMSHEIRTPLNAILGFTDIIKNKVSHLVDKEEHSFFRTIDLSGKRLLKTIHAILDISQIEAGTYELNPKPFDLVALVQKIYQEFKPLAEEKGLSISFLPKVKKAVIKADEYSLEQAVKNFVDNAVKFTGEGKVTISLEKKRNTVNLSIKDTGIGMTEKYQNKPFELFSQESVGYTKKFQGIGLGLILAKQHLEMNNVKLNIQSKKDRGTTVMISCETVS